MPRTSTRAVGLLLVALCATACDSGHGSSGADPSPATTASAKAVSYGPPWTETTYAESLLAKVRVPADAKLVAQAPLGRLRKIFEQPSLYRAPTILTRFWTIDEPWSAAYAFMAAHAPAGEQMGGGALEGPNGILQKSLERDQVGALLPSAMATGEIYVSVAPIGPRSSAIAAYALTLAQPKLPTSNLPPTRGSTVTLGWWETQHGPHPTRILTGADATEFVNALEQAKVSTIGEHGCPMLIAHDDITIAIRAGGHVWRSDLVNCWPMGLTRDGHSVVALDYTQALLAQIKKWTGHLPGDQAKALFERQR